ncbi:MAG: IS701 family transposase [Sedimentisphaerales bacterium]
MNKFLAKFDDCFSRKEPRQDLRIYIKGQLSDLPRKSVEPIALAGRIAPRTLQYFLSCVPWDQQRLVDKQQWLVAKEHAHPRAIGIIDESGNPKKGVHTAGVQRQWCGNTGKIDNCVVAVHTAYAAGDFQCILDSDLYLPKQWSDDLARRREVGIPQEVVYRKKTEIALDQIRRAMGNGIRVWAWTFDELYGRDHEFLDGLQALGQNYVGQIPSDFTGWLKEPQILQRPTPQERRKRGKKRRFPRLSAKALQPCEVRNLLVYSRVFQKQKWQKFHIKDGEKGPIVWEVKAAKFYRKHTGNGLPGPAHYLIIARNALNPKEVKYFLSNMVPSASGISLENLLWIGFSRDPIERCFEVGKQQLGMDHFEVRGWLGIHRHFYITQLSFLFCSIVHQKLREKKHQRFISDGRAGSRRCLQLDHKPVFTWRCQSDSLPTGRHADFVSSKAQSAGSEGSSQEDSPEIADVGHKSKPIAILCTS